MTGPIDWLVFSRDRPLQVDALLRSLERHATDVTRTVTVLYRSSGGDFESGYMLARSRWPWAWFAPEIDFRYQVETWFEQATETVGFLCDDDAFYRPAPAVIELPFSFRLGLNCRFQHPTGLEQIAPTPFGDIADGLSWSWRDADGDFGYPLSLDGHVYRKPTLENPWPAGYVDPTTLEAALASNAASFKPLMMHSPGHSCLVSIPANRVTEHSHNPIMPNGPSVDELADAYVHGRTLALDEMDFSGVQGAHWEVELVY